MGENNAPCIVLGAADGLQQRQVGIDAHKTSALLTRSCSTQEAFQATSPETFMPYRGPLQREEVVELGIGTVSSPTLVPLPGVSSDIPDDEGEGHVASLQYLVVIRYTRSEIRLLESTGCGSHRPGIESVY